MILDKKKIKLTVNGVLHELDVEVDTTLANILREKLGLTGTKTSCEVGECGACTVLLDDKAVNSCIVLAAELDGCKVTTIEGIGKDGKLDPVQKAFIEVGAVQCGYCTPGMVMSTKGLLNENPSPDEEEIKHALAGNFCRCTGYNRIVKAVTKAADMIKNDEAEAESSDKEKNN